MDLRQKTSSHSEKIFHEHYAHQVYVTEKENRNTSGYYWNMKINGSESVQK